MNPIGWHQIVLPVVMCGVFAALALRRPRYRFVLMGLATLVAYAVLQDQVSARLCPEYFTVMHPPIPGLTDPTLLGISWGFLGAWWGGAMLGLGLGMVATVGPRPVLSPRELVRPLAVYVGGLAAVTALTGYTVWRHANLLDVSLGPGTTDPVPPENRRGLLTVACYHFSCYATGSIGGVILCAWVWTVRRKSTGTENLECRVNSSA